MTLTERLRQAYQNGKRERLLLKKKFTHLSVMSDNQDGIPYQASISYQEAFKKVMEFQQHLAVIPRPRGFFESLAYDFGGGGLS